MSNTSKADLCAEIAAVCQEQGKPLPEGLETLKQVPLFDLLESLTGKKDPRRPASPVAGAVRASAPPPAADAPKAEEPKAEEPKLDVPKAAEEPKVEEPKVEEPKADEPEADEPEADEPKADEPKADPAACPERCVVAEGKVVHCLRGPVGAFEYIRDMDLGGGRAELEKLFAEGTVVAQRR